MSPTTDRGGTQEIAELIEVLSDAESRLERLTGGEVDAVLTRDGRTFMLQRSQVLMRQHEAQRQAAILDALPASVALVDGRGTIVSVNEAWRRFGADNSAPTQGVGVGANYIEVCDNAQGEEAAMAQAVASAMRGVLQGRLPSYAVEYPCHAPHALRWFLLMISPLKGRALSGAVVTHVDITDRTSAQHATQRSSELLKAVITGTPDSVFVKDLDGRYLLCNEALAQLVGRSVEDIIGKTLAELQVVDRAIVSSEGVLDRTEVDRLVMKTGQPISTEDTFRTGAGVRIYMATKAPYRNEHGEIVGVIGISRDITERKEAESRLRESQSLLAMASRLALVGSWYFDVPRGRIFWSDALALMHDEAPGFSPAFDQALAYYRPEHRAAINAVVGACASEGKAFDVEYPIVTAMGRHIWVRAIGEAVRDGTGAITRVQGALQDVSERKRAEDALRELNAELEARVLARTTDLTQAREEAEQANRAKSAFLAAMSHEIRTPMNGVVGLIDVLEQSQLRSAQARIVKTVRESTYALLGIVDDVLDFSKIEAGHFHIDREPLSLHDVIAQVRDALDNLASGKGVRLGLVIDERLPPRVLGDAPRLRQVLLNLVGNAIKFSSGNDRQGEVDLRAALLRRDAQRCAVEFVIADNGIGMDEATLARLFTPFMQADDSSTKRYGGTGLGLSISQRLAHLMGGRISVVSLLGEGSRFTLAMEFDCLEPVVQDRTATVDESVDPATDGYAESNFGAEAVTTPMPLAETHAGAADRLILVAEDNEVNQSVIQQQLALLGFTVDLAANGQVALDLWRGGRYAMLLTDLHMPALDGYELATAIRRAEAPGVRIPIVALTANALKADIKRCREIGMDAHMTKPLRLSALHAMLAKWLPADVQPLPLRVVPTHRARSASPPVARTAPDASTTAAVDLSVLSAFVGSDPVVIREMLDAFRRSAGRCGEAVRAGVRTGDCKSVADALHSLKSAARAIGALRLADVCDEMEISADAGRAAELDAQLQRFEQQFAEVHRSLEVAAP